MKNEHSVAAIVYNKDEYLLLKYEMGHWGLVKGNVENDENEKQTIIRELEEETGINDAQIIEGFRENYEYYYKFKGNLIHKTVNCLLIESNEKDVKLSYEHTDYEWLPYDRALERLSHENTQQILARAKNFISNQGA
ncbi:MAG: NUDIX domain-containing protein [Candidatus Lokiarchaeota archaeon]|nr:NUDIX domain-containing protein [Candidatus Lokiarchaeota archaeon]